MEKTDMALTICMEQLASITRNKNKKGQFAPHKPVLLLSIIDLVETGKISSEIVELSDQLCKKFKEVWDRHVPNAIQFNPDITKPFFHLSSEPFWQLIPTCESGILNVAEENGEQNLPTPQYTMKYMQSMYEYAKMDRSLFLFMKDHDSRIKLRQVLYALLMNTELHTTFHGKTTMLKLDVKGDLSIFGDLLTKNSHKTVKQSAA